MSGTTIEEANKLEFIDSFIEELKNTDEASEEDSLAEKGCGCHVCPLYKGYAKLNKQNKKEKET